MAHAKTISYIDAVQQAAREQIRSELRTMLEPVRVVLSVLDARSKELDARIKIVEKRTTDLYARAEVFEERLGLPPVEGGTRPPRY